MTQFEAALTVIVLMEIWAYVLEGTMFEVGCLCGALSGACCGIVGVGLESTLLALSIYAGALGSALWWRK